MSLYGTPPEDRPSRVELSADAAADLDAALRRELEAVLAALDDAGGADEWLDVTDELVRLLARTRSDAERFLDEGPPR